MKYDDVDGNGYYDVKDFLDMKNEEILKENDNKRWDVCLMNPPYGSRTSGTNPHLHLEFTKKCLDLANEVISIFPDRLITSSSKKYDTYKEIFDNRLESIERIKAYEAFDISVGSVGIFTFRKEKSDNIEIIDLDGNKETINSLLEKGNQFTEYEQNIFRYLENDNIKLMRAHFQNPGKELKSNKEFLYKKCESLKDKFKDKPIYLTTCLANGGMSAKFIFGKMGRVFDNYKDLANDWYNRNGSGMAVLAFKSIKAAENCKIALQNPVLRVGLYRLQDDQNMHARVYKYVPDIDWADDRVKTDEGLLEVCGCPKDKCKEYADYCKKVINKLDNK